jgi:hypothetical protein
MTTAQQIGGAVGIAVLITVATAHTTHALASGAARVSALSGGFTAAFAIEVGILAIAGLLALVLLRPDRHAAGVRELSGAVASGR